MTMSFQIFKKAYFDKTRPYLFDKYQWKQTCSRTAQLILSTRAPEASASMPAEDNTDCAKLFCALMLTVLVHHATPVLYVLIPFCHNNPIK